MKDDQFKRKSNEKSDNSDNDAYEDGKFLFWLL
jgi:hypothetical protein